MPSEGEHVRPLAQEQVRVERLREPGRIRAAGKFGQLHNGGPDPGKVRVCRAGAGVEVGRGLGGVLRDVGSDGFGVDGAGEVVSSGSAMNGARVDLYSEPQQVSGGCSANQRRQVLHGPNRLLDQLGKPV